MRSLVKHSAAALISMVLGDRLVRVRRRRSRGDTASGNEAQFVPHSHSGDSGDSGCDCDCDCDSDCWGGYFNFASESGQTDIHCTSFRYAWERNSIGSR